MESVVVSWKYQLMIPEKIRREAGIKPGDRMAVILKHNIIHYVSVRAISETKTMIPGLDVTNLRDERDRL